MRAQGLNRVICLLAWYKMPNNAAVSPGLPVNGAKHLHERMLALQLACSGVDGQDQAVVERRQTNA